MIESDSIKSDNTHLNDRPPRWRFQFSLRSLLLLILIVALILTSVLMYRRMSAAERELAMLRNMAGYLKIDDENLLYAIALEPNDPLTWHWRVYLPAGHKYSWHIKTGNIPADGLPKDSGSSTDVMLNKKGTEAIIYLSFRKNSDNNWITTLTRQSMEEKKQISFTGTNDVINQLLKANMTEVQCLGNGKADSRKPDEPIIFLKNRIYETQPNGSSKQPTPGIMMWLETVP